MAAETGEDVSPRSSKESSKLSYEEWRCEIKGGKVERIKKLRDNVKLNETQAETLNSGYSNESDYAVMYFLPEN